MNVAIEADIDVIKTDSPAELQHGESVFYIDKESIYSLSFNASKISFSSSSASSGLSWMHCLAASRP